MKYKYELNKIEAFLVGFAYITFIVLKIIGSIDVSWWIVLAPFWFPLLGLIISIWIRRDSCGF